MIHDHEMCRDWHNGNQLFLTCFCYCDECYNEQRRIYEDNGCVCTECFCRQEVKPRIYVSHKELGPDKPGWDLPPKRKPTETVIRDLPEHPGKTGTCRKCKGPTFRQGTRGRFPVICENCK